MNSINIEREAAWHYLCSRKSIGIEAIEKLTDYFDISEIIKMKVDKLKEYGLLTRTMLYEWDITTIERNNYLEEYGSLMEKDYCFISIEHPDYPEKLKNISLSPYGLWIKGKLTNKRCAAIIGSRECTDYGLDVAKRLGGILAEWDIGVVSGMALGIDAAGQLAALRNKGYSLGVLGCGVDICYPRQNINLYELLKTNGGIVSEFPPGTPGYPLNFRQRNRIISGLADCVIVVEAKKKSGTQVTVSWALDQGKDIFCIPGRINDNYSLGCNQLISQGADILYSIDKLKEYFGITMEENNNTVLSEHELLVYKLMTGEVQHFETILIKSSLKTGELWKVLFDLEQKKLISQPLKNYYKLCI